MSPPLGIGLGLQNRKSSSGGGGGGGSTDPFFSDVVLLAHFDGTDGATAFVDSSSFAKTITAAGNAQLDTAIKKFGTASLLLDGSGDYASLADSDHWNTSGDFTWEAWVYLDVAEFVADTYYPIFAQSSLDGISRHIMFIYANATGQAKLYFTDEAFPGLGFNLAGAADSFTERTWTHVAACRSGDTFKAFVNGVQTSGVSYSGYTPANCSSLALIGGYSDAGVYFPTRDFKGSIDDLRITLAARYTSNFTPPTEAFPDVGTYTPSLDFSKAANSMYIPVALI